MDEANQMYDFLKNTTDDNYFYEAKEEKYKANSKPLKEE
eukprot:CAMPEP_0205811502 /NCGR_PEP_ID=MMETSP0205-20121125/15700_1 /ASSEMBLY_ACC=CAM_ASM_000278 /TAXON_ID=36767 /ORGANISM="Euplotes focardii, Strain TN1" /LENGTH=38 /DNA_ID= /DNA_START= /DNA_END= /DNA_ORIENTATION=